MPRNPIAIVINRPYGDPVRLRLKGAPMLMDDGSVNVACLDEHNHTFWIGINPDTLRSMLEKT